MQLKPTKNQMEKEELSPPAIVDLKPIERLSQNISILLENKEELIRVKDLSPLLNEVRQYIQQLKSDVFNVILRNENDNYVMRYVRNNQKALIRICNQVLKQPDTDRISTSLESLTLFFTEVYNELENHLDYLEKAFPRYFDLAAEIPTGLRLKNQFDFLSRVSIMKSQTACELKKIALKPIEDFISDENSSYCNLYYLQGLLNEIEQSCTDCGECDLKESLIRHNFNNHEFFIFETGEITSELANEDNNQDKMQILHFHLKETRQVPINESLNYNEGFKSIKEQLISWLIIEIEYLKEQGQSPMVVELGEKQEEGQKIETPLTVGQIAYLVKLLVDVGVFVEKPVKRLIYFFIKNIYTKRTKCITYGGFRKCYYEASDVTKQEIRKKLLKALEIIG